MAFLTKAANRGSISTGYDIDNSLKFETDNTEYLMAEGRPAGNQQTWTYSCWLKRTEVNNGNIAQHIFSAAPDGTTKVAVYFRDDASYPGDRIFIYVDEGNAQKWIGQVNQSFRDTAAWYHFVFACDSTDGTAADRTKIYMNGVQQTITYNATLNQNVSTRVGDSGGKFAIGGKVGNTSYGFNGYMAECVLVDGSALAPTSFGEVDEDSGIWKPKDVSSLSLGTAGFHMNFDDSSNVGAVQSGTSQGNFDKYNLSAADQSTDTPTNNFCTVFPPPDAVSGIEPSVKEGGTTIFGGSSSTQNAFGTLGVRSGKWYFESTITNSGGVDTDNHGFGVIDPEQITYVMTSGRDVGASPAGWNCSSNSLPRNNNAAASGANSTAALAVDKIMGVAIDMDNGKIWWHREGTWTSISGTVGNPADGTAPAFSNLLTATDNFVIPAVGFYVYNGNQVRATNFGGYALPVFTAVGTHSDANGYGSFAYAPPTGFYALCTKNLAEYG